jgi:hypothetical protein
MTLEQEFVADFRRILTTHAISEIRLSLIFLVLKPKYESLFTAEETAAAMRALTSILNTIETTRKTRRRAGMSKA